MADKLRMCVRDVKGRGRRWGIVSHGTKKGYYKKSGFIFTLVIKIGGERKILCMQTNPPLSTVNC